MDTKPSFRFHHVAMAVHNLDDAFRTVSALGFVPSDEYPDVRDEGLRVELRFLKPQGGGPLLELVAGIGEKNPVEEILEKSGPGLYHMCFEVENIEEAGSFLRKQGYRPVTSLLSATAFKNRRIQFFYHIASGLIELLESN